MSFDVVIRNGRLLDGTGMPWAVRDVGVRNGRIVRVGRLGRGKAALEIDASGKYVAPGFIDIHTHSDVGLLVEPTAEAAVRQGVTTQVIGNCGDSPAPISERYRELAVRRFTYYAQASAWTWSTYGEYLQFLEKGGVGINVAGLVGHGSVRLAAMGFEERAPTKAEMREMKGSLD
jgi:N-acyl-D-amino-acid deacylase